MHLLIEMLIRFFGLDSVILPILFFSLYCMLAGLIIFLLLLILFSLENSRLSDSVNPTDLNVVSVNEKYLQLLSEYEALLNERILELHRVEQVTKNLETQMSILLKSSKSTSFFDLVSLHFNSILTVIVVFIIFFYRNKMLMSDSSVIVNASLKSNETLQKTLLDSTESFTNLILKHLQGVIDSSTDKILKDLAKSVLDLSNGNESTLVSKLKILLESISTSDAQSLCDTMNQLELLITKIALLDHKISLLTPFLDAAVAEAAISSLADPVVTNIVSAAAFG